MEDDEVPQAVFTEHEGSDSQMNAVKFLDAIAHFLSMAGEAFGTVSARTQFCITEVARCGMPSCTGTVAGRTFETQLCGPTVSP